MDYAFIKASLNLHAVLQNLEELVRYDPTSAELARPWRVAIQFIVRNGPTAYIQFKDGTCTVEAKRHPHPDVKLYFTSPDHLNRMMDNNANPIPLKGFTRLKFLTKEFPKVTDRLEYYLKPTDERLKSPEYLVLNTRMTLNTAAFAVRDLALYDPIGKLNAAHIPDGTIVMEILPDGPAVHIRFEDGRIEVEKASAKNPMALMQMRDMETASAFLNGRLDAFTAVAAGDIRIRGRIPMIDAMGTILDRIPHYLS